MRPPPVLMLMLLLVGLPACGGESNVADCESGKPGVPCSELTKEEQARQALNGGDYDTAVTLFTELVAEEPENYQLRAVLGASYAARAGFAILSVVKANFGSSGTLFDQLNAFLPDPAERGQEGFRLSIADMGGAVAAIQGIPEDKRSDTSEETYAASALLQLMLYQSAYSIMYLNQFAISATTGQFDPAQLATMTEEDALIVLNNLAAAGALQTDDPALQQKIQEALTDINSQPGSSNKDRLSEFITKEQQPQP